MASSGQVTCLKSHSNEEVEEQETECLALFTGLLCASLAAKTLNRDRNGQAMARKKHGSHLAGRLGEARLNGGQEAGQRSLYFSPNSYILSCRQSCHRVRGPTLQLEEGAPSSHGQLARDMTLEWDCPGSLTMSLAV